MVPAKYRQTAYLVTAVVLAVLFVAGILTPEQVNGWVEMAGKALGTAAAILALLNVTPDE